MEFTPRGGRGPAPQATPHVATQHVQSAGRRKHIDWAQRTVRIELFIVLVGSALLLAAVSLYAAFSGNSIAGEAGRINKNQYQAVFLNGGVTSGSVSYSTYFGHLTKLNDKYAVLKDVYYLTDQGSTSSQTSSPQLTKLGCQQLHSPEDEMVVNRSQIAFWENIKDSGKVVQAIKQFKQQNPNGPNCSQQSSNSNSSSQTQSTTTPPATTTPPSNSAKP
jgi:hypothetical protein